MKKYIYVVFINYYPNGRENGTLEQDTTFIASEKPLTREYLQGIFKDAAKLAKINSDPDAVKTYNEMKLKYPDLQNIDISYFNDDYSNVQALLDNIEAMTEDVWEYFTFPMLLENYFLIEV